MYMWCIWPRVLKCTYTFVVLFGTLWIVCIMMLKRTPITCDSRISLLTWERPQAHTITDTHTAHDGKHFTDPVTDGGPAAAEQMPHAPKVSVRAFYKLMRFSPRSMHGYRQPSRRRRRLVLVVCNYYPWNAQALLRCCWLVTRVCVLRSAGKRIQCLLNGMFFVYEPRKWFC